MLTHVFSDNLTGDGLMEGTSERVSMSGDPSIDLEDERMDSSSRRELKSEPSESLGEVYVGESSDIGTDQSQHSDGIDHRPIIYPLGS